MPSSLSIARLGHAPHRLMFFAGTANLLLAMAWWALWLAGARWGAWAVPLPRVSPGLLHAFLMQYQVLPCFIFGFLLTVFPRWIGRPDLDWRHALPVGIGLLGGQILVLAGAMGWGPGILAGSALTLAGWIIALSPLARLAWNDRGRTWHAAACFGALLAGAVGQCLWLAFLLGGDAALADLAVKIGTFGLLAPIYFTVAHRMIPFFAASALQGYRPWRPYWALGMGLGLMLLMIALPLRWQWLGAVPLCALSLLLLARWFPKRDMPGLLLVLFIGFAWLPCAFALHAGQSLALALWDWPVLGKAPAHALFIGFFGSILVAMVTRVTQGHSGRPLILPGVAIYAFVAVQVVCIARIAGELAQDWLAWQAFAAAGWLLAFGPWAIWAARIYLLPRADGKPG